MDIRIRFKDEVKCFLEVDRSIAYELKAKFSFYVDGYKFNPRYVHGGWDGTISLYNIKTSEFPVGLLPDLVKYAKESNYKIEIAQDDRGKFKPKIVYEEGWLANNWKRFLNFEPYDYQVSSIEAALKHNKSLILSPTGSGKSLIIWVVLRYLFEHTEGDILVTVPSVSLVEQLYANAEEYFHDGFDIDANVAKIYDGSPGETTGHRRIIISTWQSMVNRPESYFKRFSSYLIDECHQADAKSITSIIDKMTHCTFRMGCTGTLNGKSLHEIQMKSLLGRVFKFVTTAELMERGELAMLNVDCLNLKYPLDDCKLITKGATTYQQEIDFLIEHPKRNELLVKLAMKQEKNSLMLFNYVERHGGVLMAMMSKVSSKHLKKVYYIHGKVKADEREQTRKILEQKDPFWVDIQFKNNMLRLYSATDVVLENKKVVKAFELNNLSKIDIMWLQDAFKNEFNYNEKTEDIHNNISSITKKIGCCILLASYGTLSTGINIKQLHTLILCHPLKAQIRLLQSIGRILRSAEGKGDVKLIDIVDDLSYMRGKKVQQNTVLKHFYERLKIYEAESFQYKILTLEL